MMLTFQNIIDLIAVNFFDGSAAMAALVILVAMWAVCAVICIMRKRHLLGRSFPSSPYP